MIPVEAISLPRTRPSARSGSTSAFNASRNASGVLLAGAGQLATPANAQVFVDERGGKFSTANIDC